MTSNYFKVCALKGAEDNAVKFYRPSAPSSVKVSC